MKHTFFVLASVSLDVFSFGISCGVSGLRLTAIKALFFTAVSMVIFAVPLALSRIIFGAINPQICFLINGSALLCLGAWYLGGCISKKLFLWLKLAKNRPVFKSFGNPLIFYRKNQIDASMGLKSLALFAIPVNLDAFFTALLSGFGFVSFFDVLVLYSFLTLFALEIGNILSLKLSHLENFDFSWVSGFLFISLGILKLV